MPIAPEPPARPAPSAPSLPPTPRATPAPSLVRFLAEVDARWPLRDRRTDGWFRDPHVGISYGHNPDGRGRVHARDVDRDGLNPDWIIDHIRRSDTGLWYIIWDRKLWSMDHNWVPYAYHGKSPHTDHFHIEIRHTEAAWRYAGPWGVAPEPTQVFGEAPTVDRQWGQADPLVEMVDSADSLAAVGDHAYGYGDAIAMLRPT